MTRTTSFKKVVVCHTNDFKSDLNDKIKSWVEANGGTFSKDLTPAVTHLVASRKAWKRYHPIVKQARKMRTIHVVKYDWLEDSLLKSPIRALPTDGYLFEQNKFKAIKMSKRKVSGEVSQDPNTPKKIVIPREKRIETAGIEFDKARQEFEQDMGMAGFHPYSDKTGFVYIITLLRYDISKKAFEKYKLKLYESDQEPHTYACYMQYTRPAVSKQVLVLAPPGSTWDFAWSAFQRFFLRKVRTSWEERASNGSEINLDGSIAHGTFQYQTPRVGDPEGDRLSSDGDVTSDTNPASAFEASHTVTEVLRADTEDHDTNRALVEEVDATNTEAEQSDVEETSTPEVGSQETLDDKMQGGSSQGTSDEEETPCGEEVASDEGGEYEIDDAHLP